MELYKFLPLMGVAIFVYILLGFNLSAIISNVVRANPALIAAAVMLHLPVLALKALKWRVIISSYGIRLGLAKSIVYWCVGFFIGLITPGRLGDMARAWYLRGKTSFGRAMTTVVVDRVMDVAVVFVMAIAGAAAFVALYVPETSLVITISLLFAAFILALFVFSKKSIMVRITKPLLGFLIPSRHRGEMEGFVDEFYAGLKKIVGRKKLLLGVALTTLLYWLITFFQLYVLSRAIGINISFIGLLMFMPIVTLLDILPISFSGIGTRDAAMIFFFSFFMLQPEVAVAYSFLILFFAYVPPAIAGLAFWFRNPIKISGLKAAE